MDRKRMLGVSNQKASKKISKDDKKMKKQFNGMSKVLPPKVFIVDSTSFKDLVQELTGNNCGLISSRPPMQELSKEVSVATKTEEFAISGELLGGMDWLDDSSSSSPGTDNETLPQLLEYLDLEMLEFGSPAPEIKPFLMGWEGLYDVQSDEFFLDPQCDFSEIFDIL
ncbi:hypothetical protein QJS10_CPB14g00488 [Acorus calamus]|uniref:VQ domain-containing protein n=1 Tax=Acorus calamus TaxID=4465 RepID=A0AAV9DDI2_ACOCL|nr:hypothetical protein QJS10_CPB14g00488 [Acorus calamus]